MALQNFLFEVRNPSSLRAVIAAFAAPPIAMLGYGIIASVVLSRTSGSATVNKILGMTGMTCLYGSALAYLGMVLVGLPASLALKAMNEQRGVAYLLIGTFPLPLLLLLRSGTLPDHAAPILLAATPGFFVAGCWWFLATL